VDEVEARQVRAGRNQALFREVNERVRSLSAAWPAAGEVDFVCECANEDCARPLSLDLGQYEAVRADPTTFVVAPGHVYPDVEEVVREEPAFVVVRKMGAARPIAESSAPRRPTG